MASEELRGSGAISASHQPGTMSLEREHDEDIEKNVVTESSLPGTSVPCVPPVPQVAPMNSNNNQSMKSDDAENHQQTTPTTSSSTDSGPAVTEKEVNPDGGYGWVIVMASFAVHLIIMGNVFSFGVFYPRYIEYFQTDQGDIAWVGSLGSALMVGFGVW